jgi:hypothetical protein
MLFGFSAGKAEQRLANGEAGGRIEGSIEGGAKGRTVCDRPVVRRLCCVSRRRRKVLFRIRSLSALRARMFFVLLPRVLSALRKRRGLVGAGVAVALVFDGVDRQPRLRSRARRRVRTSGEPAARPSARSRSAASAG